MATTRMSTKLIAAVATLICAAAHADGEYKWGDSFEKFSGASGTSINGTPSDSGMFTWSADNTVSVVKRDGTAYHRKSFMRISDTSSSQRQATITLADENRIPFAVCPTSAQGSVFTPLSFAFRRSLVSGQESNVTGLNLTISCASTDETPSTSTLVNGLNIFGNIPSDDTDWYLFQADLLAYHWSQSQTQPIVYNIRITKVGADTPVYSNSNTYRTTFQKYTDVVVTQIKFMTWSAGQAIIDIDDIRVGDYEYPPVPGLMILVL